MGDGMTDDQIGLLLLTYVKPRDAERNRAADVRRRVPVLLEEECLSRGGWIVRVDDTVQVEPRRTLRIPKGATRSNEFKKRLGE